MTTKTPTPSDILRLADRYEEKLEYVVMLAECIEIPGSIADDTEKQKERIREFTGGLWRFRQYLLRLGFVEADLHWPSYVNFHLTDGDRDA